MLPTRDQISIAPSRDRERETILAARNNRRTGEAKGKEQSSLRGATASLSAAFFSKKDAGARKERNVGKTCENVYRDVFRLLIESSLSAAAFHQADCSNFPRWGSVFNTVKSPRPDGTRDLLAGATRRQQGGKVARNRDFWTRSSDRSREERGGTVLIDKARPGVKVWKRQEAEEEEKISFEEGGILYEDPRGRLCKKTIVQGAGSFARARENFPATLRQKFVKRKERKRLAERHPLYFRARDPSLKNRNCSFRWSFSRASTSREFQLDQRARVSSRARIHKEAIDLANKSPLWLAFAWLFNFKPIANWNWTVTNLRRFLKRAAGSCEFASRSDRPWPVLPLETPRSPEGKGVS